MESEPTFFKAQFERRFHVPCKVHEQLRESVLQAYTYFEGREDALGKRGLSKD